LPDVVQHIYGDINFNKGRAMPSVTNEDPVELNNGMLDCKLGGETVYKNRGYCSKPGTR
jgi:hypothetical protein